MTEETSQDILDRLVSDLLPEDREDEIIRYSIGAFELLVMNHRIAKMREIRQKTEITIAALGGLGSAIECASTIDRTDLDRDVRTKVQVKMKLQHNITILGRKLGTQQGPVEQGLPASEIMAARRKIQFLENLIRHSP